MACQHFETVWPVLFDSAGAVGVAEVLRSWREEDPRELWFRLRDEGPKEEPAEAVAQWLWLQARAGSGVPVFWSSEERITDGEAGDSGPHLLQGDKRAQSYYRAWQNKATGALRLMQSDGRGVLRTPGHKGSHYSPTKSAGQKGFNAAGAGGLVRTETVAERIEFVSHLVAQWLALQSANALGKPVSANGEKWKTAGYAHLSDLASASHPRKSREFGFGRGSHRPRDLHGSQLSRGNRIWLGMSAVRCAWTRLQMECGRRHRRNLRGSTVSLRPWRSLVLG